MSNGFKMPRRIFVMFCLSCVLSFTAMAQTDADLSGSSDEAKFYELIKTTSSALTTGETEKAKFHAESLLKQADVFRENWAYGNALHVGNLVLGHLAFNEGDMSKAGHYLLEAGKTPGSPQLKTFGPSMLLAKQLLENEEYETVLKYLDLCRNFWKMEDGRLDEWKKAVENQQMPDFGANLRYQLDGLQKEGR